MGGTKIMNERKGEVKVKGVAMLSIMDMKQKALPLSSPQFSVLLSSENL